MRLKAWVLVLAFLWMTGQAAAQERSPAVVPVLVYNYAQVSPETLRSAQAHVNRIFRETGVAFEWHACRVALSEPQKDPYCLRTPRRTDLVLKILPQSRTAAFGLPSDVAGFVPPGHLVSDAYVFYDRLHEIARRESEDVAPLLGSIIAHELGHLLTDSAEHSSAGVMRAEWTGLALRRASFRETQFSSEQSRHIRLGALARVSRAEPHPLARSNVSASVSPSH